MGMCSRRRHCRCRLEPGSLATLGMTSVLMTSVLMVHAIGEPGLEAPDCAYAQKIVMLAGFAGWSLGKVGLSRPEIAAFCTQDDALRQFDVQADAVLQHARGGGLPGIGRVVVQQRLALADMPKAPAHAAPKRNCSGGEQVHAHRGGYEQRL